VSPPRKHSVSKSLVGSRSEQSPALYAPNPFPGLLQPPVSTKEEQPVRRSGKPPSQSRIKKEKDRQQNFANVSKQIIVNNASTSNLPKITPDNNYHS